ncbi:MAG TPA: cytochrome c oxidase subunit II [Actinomycetota bacterium]|nr:cytochrome c oxidase subunit II [Actinomycetota bacterium]
MTTKRARRIVKVLAGLAALGLLAACSNVGPQDYLHPEGPVAEQADSLFKPVFWIATAIFFVVEGLMVYAIFKFRERRGGSDPVQVHGNTKLEIGWTIAPAVLLAALAVPTVAMIFDQAAVPAEGEDVVRVKVIGHQWWWEYEYTDVDPPVKTANELVIPVGKKVFLEVTSADVIHSFWVPKLGGKQDAIPGRMNSMTLIADKPDVYHGQCAEFCALSHANMRLRARALPQAEYDAWLAEQQKDAVVPTSGAAAEGARAFKEFQNGTCMACHTIRGMEGASGTVGPDLTHFADRLTFAGSIFDMNEENLAKWLRDPPGVKPGSIMPNYHIPEETIAAMVAFLLSLK